MVLTATMHQVEKMAPDRKTVHKVWWECGNCGTIVEPFDKFCSGCGRRFTNARSR